MIGQMLQNLSIDTNTPLITKYCMQQAIFYIPHEQRLFWPFLSFLLGEIVSNSDNAFHRVALFLHAVLLFDVYLHH